MGDSIPIHAMDETITTTDSPKCGIFVCFAAYIRKKEVEPQNLDDVLHIHQGPLDADALAAEASNINLDMHLGVFRQHAVRRAFEKRQMPWVRLRSFIVGILFACFTAITGITRSSVYPRAEVGTLQQGTLIAGPMWYTFSIATFALCCALFMHLLPTLARRCRCPLLASPRVADLSLLFFVAIYVSILPRLWGDWDPFELRGQMPERGAHALRIAAFGFTCASGGVFFNPVIALTTGAFSVHAWCVRFNEFRAAAIVAQAQTATASGCWEPPLALHFIDFWMWGGIALLMCLQHERTVIQQFRFECAVQLAATHRIDQLGNEKERLDYERRMEVKKLEAQIGASVRNGRQGPAGGGDAMPSEKHPTNFSVRSGSNTTNGGAPEPPVAPSSYGSCSEVGLVVDGGGAATIAQEYAGRPAAKPAQKHGLGRNSAPPSSPCLGDALPPRASNATAKAKASAAKATTVSRLPVLSEVALRSCKSGQPNGPAAGGAVDWVADSSRSEVSGLTEAMDNEDGTAAGLGGLAGDARPTAPTPPGAPGTPGAPGAPGAPGIMHVCLSAREVGMRPMSSQSNPLGATRMVAPKPVRVAESCRLSSATAAPGASGSAGGDASCSFRVPSEHQASLFFTSLFRPTPPHADRPNLDA